MDLHTLLCPQARKIQGRNGMCQACFITLCSSYPWLARAGLGEGLDVHSRVVFKHSKVNVAWVCIQRCSSAFKGLPMHPRVIFVHPKVNSPWFTLAPLPGASPWLLCQSLQARQWSFGCRVWKLAMKHSRWTEPCAVTSTNMGKEVFRHTGQWW